MGLSLTKKKRTAADAWIESLDPLNGLSIAQARNIHNAARRHGSPLLQKMFAEIEETDPVLMTCVERRQSALAGLGWRTVANASARDQGLAEEQRVALEEFANGIEDIDDAIEHLGLAFFRGYSVCQPIWSGNAVRRIELLDSWNFLHAGGEMLWNPECSMDPAKCVPVTPEARAVVFRRRRAIDWPALNIYIRKFIGERDWGRFLERYGIPPVDVVMAPNTTNAQRDDYLESAEAARDGRPAAWPAGSQISRAEGSRGQDPFSAFLEHQEKLVVLMATGGTLTSLAQADTGSLAGGAQMDVWTQIVARDGVAVSAALNRALFAPFLREAFQGRPVLARFDLGREDEPTADEAAGMAVKLRGAGYRVDQAQLEEATGYKLERAEDGAPEQLKGSEVERWRSPGLANSSAVRLFNSSTFQPGNGAETRLAAAMQRDLRPVGKAIAAALKNRDWGALRKKLGGMLPECGTESADVIEEAVREDGEEAQKNKKDGETEAVANSECRAKDPAHCPTHGTPEGREEKVPAKKKYKPATRDAVEKFQKELPGEITPEEFDSLLTAGFDDTDGEGNTVKYGTLLRDHIDQNHTEQDRDARKKRLGVAVAMVRQSTPLPTGTEGKPEERMYAGIIDGNAYIAVADEHNEIGALEMVSYRRGKRKEVRKAQSDTRTHSPSNVPTDPQRVRPTIAQPAPEGKEKE